MASTEAQKAKDRGNEAFKAGKYAKAIGNYTSAIFADRNDPTYPLNRAAAYLKLGKYEDAERDCSTVLELKPGHVKALYRRAQARSKLEKLPAAQQDLTEALRVEPTNHTVKAELKRINDQLLKSKVPSKYTINVAPPKRRRVPIEVIEPSTESTLPSDSNPAVSTLNPISSRALNQNGANGSPIPPSPLNQQTSPPTSMPQEQTQIPPSNGGPHSLSSHVRGGIFRQSGEHTVFRPPPTQVNGSNTDKREAFSIDSKATQSPPISLFEFTRQWEIASASERWDLICKIPPSALPMFFKTSLEAPLLVSIVEVFSLAVSSTGELATKKRVQEYLNYFPRIPRFNTVTMFMNKGEKELCKTLIDTVGNVSGWRI